MNQLAKAANSGSLPVNQNVLKALNEANSSVHWIRKTRPYGLIDKPSRPYKSSALSRRPYRALSRHPRQSEVINLGRVNTAH